MAIFVAQGNKYNGKKLTQITVHPLPCLLLLLYLQNAKKPSRVIQPSPLVSTVRDISCSSHMNCGHRLKRSWRKQEFIQVKGKGQRAEPLTTYTNSQNSEVGTGNTLHRRILTLCTIGFTTQEKIGQGSS